MLEDFLLEVVRPETLKSEKDPFKQKSSVEDKLLNL